VNVVNLAIWFGYRVRGTAGALAGALGLLLPTTTLAVAVLGVFDLVSGNATIRLLLAGAIVAAIGLTLAMGMRAVRAIGLKPVPLLLCAGTVIAISVVRLPLVWVAGIGAPLAIGLAWWSMKRGRPLL
jgi:chromate transporter